MQARHATRSAMGRQLRRLPRSPRARQPLREGPRTSAEYPPIHGVTVAFSPWRALLRSIFPAARNSSTRSGVRGTTVTAAFPLDRRLPPRARQGMLDAIAPDRLIDSDGTHHLSGRGVDDGDALVVATSGTSTPRGVVLTHAAVEASAEATSARLGVSADDVWLACLPLSHVGGLSVVTRALATSTPLVVQDGFDAEAVTAAAPAAAQRWCRWCRRRYAESTPDCSGRSCSAARGRPTTYPTTSSPRTVSPRRAAEWSTTVGPSMASRFASTPTARYTCDARCCCVVTATEAVP